jgi:hypothetical protein
MCHDPSFGAGVGVMVGVAVLVDVGIAVAVHVLVGAGVVETVGVDVGAGPQLARAMTNVQPKSNKHRSFHSGISILVNCMYHISLPVTTVSSKHGSSGINNRVRV